MPVTESWVLKDELVLVRLEGTSQHIRIPVCGATAGIQDMRAGVVWEFTKVHSGGAITWTGSLYPTT